MQDAADTPQVWHWQQMIFPHVLLLDGDAPNHPTPLTPSETPVEEDDINFINRCKQLNRSKNTINIWEMLLCSPLAKVSSPCLPLSPPAAFTFVRSQIIRAERSISYKLQKSHFWAWPRRGVVQIGLATALGLHSAGPHRKGMSASCQGTAWPSSLVNCVLNQLQLHNSA